MQKRVRFAARLGLGVFLFGVPGVQAAVAADSATPSRQRAIQVYEKQVISIFRPEKRTSEEGQLYDRFVQTFVGLGRFDYYPIECANFTSFAKEVKTFLDDGIGALAESRGRWDEKFKGTPITGEALDKLRHSSYVMIPSWEIGRTELTEEQDTISENGTRTIKTTAKATLTLTNEVYNALTGELVGRQESSSQLEKPISVKIPPRLSAPATRRYLEEFFQKKNEAKDIGNRAPFRYYLEEANSSSSRVLGYLTTQVKTLDAFVLRSYISDQNDTMVLGSNVGVVPDSTWNVFRRTKSANGKTRLSNIGFMRVRDIDEKASRFQRIQDTEGFEMGDQLVEIPQNGNDVSVRLGGCSYDSGGSKDNNLGPALTLSWDANLAAGLKNPGLSETYMTMDFVFPFSPLVSTYSQVALETLFGLKKNLYFSQFILSPGFKLGAAFASGALYSNSQYDVSATSTGFGLGPSLGVEYHANPSFKLGMDMGYMLFSEVSPTSIQGRNRSTNEKIEVSYATFSNYFNTTLPKSNASGLALSVSGTYVF